jgi:broad specificity phosphatase PhoE
VPTILLIRHAQASYGAADYDVLSDLGHEQTATLDGALARRGVEPVVAVIGPARRHRDTAQLCVRTLAGARHVEDQRWGEYDTDGVLAQHATTPVSLTGGADVNGLTSQEFQVVLDGALTAWLADDSGDGGRHSWSGYLGQVSAALDELGDELETGQTAVVFTSAGAIAAACCAVLGLHSATFVALGRVQVNTGITKIVRGGRGTSLVSFNEHGHLEEADRVLVTYR